MNLAFFASHSGSNLQAVLDACHDGRLRARPCVVVSNNSQAKALQRARQSGVPCYHLSTKTFSETGALDEAICQSLQRHQTDLVILAGYMRKLGAKTLTQYRDGSSIFTRPCYQSMAGWGCTVYACTKRSWRRVKKKLV